ncbi:BUD17 [Candida theae]|uniref:pyridoxal kinase n=1 Tax=Candida theae TaxID=1198502 RepID=A0AAD5G0C5_9ASCO|nr:BUD17 [Candida theae]KAI5964494.1 BUD17 [Candida theae]
MKSLLSISSHVVHGYVGNRAITFPLQYKGWDVDAINTTNYSNHPGYGSLQGSASTPDAIRDVLQGLHRVLDLNSYDLILTGYTPNADVLSVVKDEVVQVLQKHDGKIPRWIVDPVLGDNGKMYVSEKVIPVYKEILSTGLVSLITPNQFEFEILSDTKISDWQSCESAVTAFAERYKVGNIVISSVEIDHQLCCVGYMDGKMFSEPIHKIDCNFNGCGDLFTGLIANSYYDNGYKITPGSIAAVLQTLYNILQLSYDFEFEKSGQVPKVVKDIKVVAAKRYL